jgi:TldD protein
MEQGVMQDQETVKQLRLDKVLDKAIKLGATYADIRYQSYDSEMIAVENKTLESYASRRLSGLGIRVNVKGAFGYASTSNLSVGSIDDTVNRAVKTAKAVRGKEETFAKARPLETKVSSPVKIDFQNVSPEEKVAVTLEANKAAWVGDKIKNATTRLGFVKDSRLFMSSEGAEVSVETSIGGVMHVSVAQVNGVMEWVPYSDSMCAGFEFIKSKDWNTFTEDISRLAIEAAGSKTPPSGTCTVVVDPDVVGLVLHEAFGHASEGDLVFTGESVLNKRVGDKLAADSVTIVDEGTTRGGYFYPYDDEGTKKGRTVVVENGTLKNYIHDRNSALKFGEKSTGNGRAQDFENLPIVRQTNYYMEPQDWKFDELVEDIDTGVYVRGRGSTGGEVEVGMGTFTFGVGPSKLIEKGELTETVRGVVISGLILETLKTIDAVGKDLHVRTGVFGGCGKNDQRVLVGFGGPHVRVGKMTVGGR